MNKVENMIRWYEDTFGRYGEAFQETVGDFWEEEYGSDLWEEFHHIDRKLKVKFYYEGEE